ncbi:MAG TPA: rhodanese-like domain-containing protein [Bacteroidia bacterium]|nr:rhodanese-like domain-containing protein [Bacteroidia bacterium]
MKLLNGKWALMLTMVFSFIVLTNCQSQTENKTKVEPKKQNIMKNSKEIIVDVRTEEEFEMDGHAEGSVNYPLDQIQNKIEDLKKYDHVILVCRSGNRAGIAKNILEQAGIKNVENMGPWQNAVGVVK